MDDERGKSLYPKVNEGYLVKPYRLLLVLKWILFMCFVAWTSLSTAQPLEGVSLQLLGQEDKEPLVGIRIEDERRDLIGVTDADGRVELHHVQTGDRLWIYGTGYLSRAYIVGAEQDTVRLATTYQLPEISVDEKRINPKKMLMALLKYNKQFLIDQDTVLLYSMIHRFSDEEKENVELVQGEIGVTFKDFHKGYSSDRKYIHCRLTCQTSPVLDKLDPKGELTRNRVAACFTGGPLQTKGMVIYPWGKTDWQYEFSSSQDEIIIQGQGTSESGRVEYVIYSFGRDSIMHSSEWWGSGSDRIWNIIEYNSYYKRIDYAMDEVLYPDKVQFSEVYTSLPLQKKFRNRCEVTRLKEYNGPCVGHFMSQFKSFPAILAEHPVEKEE